ncbi:Dynein heavy chain [Balamuthia mandrillaris]
MDAKQPSQQVPVPTDDQNKHQDVLTLPPEVQKELERFDYSVLFSPLKVPCLPTALLTGLAVGSTATAAALYMKVSHAFVLGYGVFCAGSMFRWITCRSNYESKTANVQSFILQQNYLTRQQEQQARQQLQQQQQPTQQQKQD